MDSWTILRRFFLLIFSVAPMLLIGCSGGEVPQGEPMSVTRPTGGEQAQAGLQLEAPEEWIEERPSSSMRLSQYRLPGDGAEDAEVAVFTGIGGSVEQNVDRWISQFGSGAKESADVSTRDVGGHEVTIVDVSGTFQGSMMPMAGGSSDPKEGWRMLAAVIETEGAPWFIKLTGPQETVGQWEESFYSYVDSLE